MSISKRLKAVGHKGPHPLADWKSDKERLGPPLDKLLFGPIAPRAWMQNQPDPGAPPGVVRRPHGFYSYDGAWSRYGEGPFPDVLPPEGNVGERCKLTFPKTCLHVMAAAEPPPPRFDLEAVVEAGHPDVDDPEAWLPPEPSEIARDVPTQYAPLPGQTNFLDALEARRAAGTAEAWGVKAKRREKKSGQTFLFMEIA